MPYRPYFAFPDRLRQVSDFKYCNAFYFSVFDPPHTLGPATAMVPDHTTVDPIPSSVAPKPSPNAHKPAQVTDPPGAAPHARPQGPAAGPAATVSADPAEKTGGAVDPGSANPAPGNNIQPPSVVASDPQSPPEGPAQDPAAIGSDDPQQAANPKADKPTTIHPPAVKQDPSNSNDESAAQMSALHQALGLASPADPQVQPASDEPAANQPAPNHPASNEPVNRPAVNQPNSNGPVSSPINPDYAAIPDPDRPAAGDPGSQNKGATPTTIQLGPQPGSEPTTIYIGSKTDGNQGDPESGANTNHAPGPGLPITDAAVPFLVVTAAGHVLTISDPSAVSIAGTVLIPNGAEATIAGTPMRLAAGGNLVVGSGPSSPSSTVLTIAGHTITANPTSFHIAGTPVKAGEPPVTIAGTVVSLGSSGNLVIGATAAITPVQPALFTVAGQVFTANPTAFAIAGTTISAGGPAISVSGTPVSLGPSGNLVIGDTTKTLANPSQSSIFDIGGQHFTANPTGFTITGTSLSAGGSGMTISGTPISLNPSGSLIIGTSTIPLRNPTPPIFTAAGQTFTIDPNGQIAIESTTLTPGSPTLTINGTPIHLTSDNLVIGTNTIPLPPTPTITASVSVITTDGQILTLESGGRIAIDGATLTSGGRGMTISGISMRLDSDGLVMGTETVPLPRISGAVSATLNSFRASASGNASSLVSGGTGAGTGKANISAASCGVRLLGMGIWGAVVVVMVLMLKLE